MDFQEYQDFAVISAIYNPEKYAIIYPALGLGNEAGEVQGKIKKVMRDNNGEFTQEWKDKIVDEMGDVLWYMAALARDLGVSLNDVAQSNVTKLTDRRNRNVIGGSGDNR